MATNNYSSPYPSAYAATDAGFKRYYDKVQQDFADRGLLDSTNKTRPLLDVADAYAAQLATQQRTDNQNAISNALSLWEMLASGALSRAQLEGSTTVRMPAQPGVFSNVFNSAIPQYSSNGPTGDATSNKKQPYLDSARGEQVPSYDDSIKTLSFQNAKTDAANAAKSLSIQQAYLNLAKQKQFAELTADDAGSTDVWDDIANDAIALLGDGSGSGYDKAMIMKAVNAQYGIDLFREAQGGNVRAQKIVELLGFNWRDIPDASTASTAQTTPSYTGGSSMPPTSKVWSGSDYKSALGSILDRIGSTAYKYPGY